MAYPVSDNFRNIIYSGGAKYDAILKINDEKIPTKQIKKITISDPFFDNTSSTFYLGQFISKQVTIEFNNMNGIPLEGNVHLEIGTLVNDQYEDEKIYEYVPIGEFLIDYNSEDYYDNCKLTCLDYAVKMKTNIDYSEDIKDESGNIQPITLENLLKLICKYYNIELGTYPNTNKDYLISTYDSTLSGKYYISLIAELMGSMAHFDRLNRLCIIPLNKQETVEINALKSKEWKYSNSYTISKVIYDNGKEKIEKGNDDNQTLYIRSDNMFVLDNKESLIENIYNAVKDVKIDSIRIENYGDFSLDCHDLIKFSLGDESYYSFNNNEIIYEMNIMSTIETNIPSGNQQETTNVISNENNDISIRKLLTTVNQQELKIDTTIEMAENNQDRITKTEQTVNSIQNLFQITGGNNLIKNSVGLFGNNYWEENEYYKVEGKCTQNGTPTPTNPIPIETIKGNADGNLEIVKTGKNYLENILTTRTVNGVTFTVNNDKTITVNGTATAQIVLTITNNINMSGKYILSGCPVGGSSTTYELQLYGSGNTVNYGNNKSISTNPNGIVRLVIRNGAVCDNLIFKPMFRDENIEDDTYEPYFKEVKLVNLKGNELCSVGDTKDELIIENNETYINKVISKINSYNGETITTSYISTTGELTTGATVYYISDEVTKIQLESTTMSIFNYGEDSNLIGYTTSASRIEIQNGKLKSTSDNISNLLINEVKTISYKVKQDEDVTTTITLYSVSKEHPLYKKTLTGRYELQEIYNENENKFYVDNSNLILEIESSSKYNGKFIITDLMLNDGDKSTWQPANSEIWGTVIKMSQLGISCYSTDGKTVTLMTSQGFQVRELHGEEIGNIITQFTNLGIETQEINQSGDHIQKKLVHTVMNVDNKDIYVEYIRSDD